MSGACYAPWGQLMVDIQGRLSPCRFSERSFGNIYAHRSVSDAYNNPSFTEARQLIVRGDWESAGCGNCKLVKLGGAGVKPPLATRAEAALLPTAYESDQNFRLNLEEYFDGATTLKSLPCEYTATLTHDPFAPWHRDEQGNDELVNMVVTGCEQVFPVARSLHWVGREAFGVKLVHQLVDTFDLTRNPNVRVIATTSCPLLTPPVLEKLSRFKNVTVSLRVDSMSKETYELIHKDDRWEQLRSSYIQVGMVGKKQGWHLGITFVAMVSNFHEIPKAVEFAHQFNLALAFEPLVGSPESNENPFDYPELIPRIPNWSSILEQAIAVTEQTSSTPDADFVVQVRESLESLRRLLTQGEDRLSRRAMAQQRAAGQA